MGALKDFRTSVATALTAGGLDTKEYVGETITPPCAVVVPADPYLELMPVGGSVPFGQWLVGVDVLVVSHKASAKKTADLMDTRLEEAIEALDGFDVTRITQPGIVTLSGAKFMASVIRVEDHIKL